MARQEVAPVVVQQQQLSVALLRSGQCLESTYAAGDDDVARYFVGIIGDVLRNDMRTLLQEQMPNLLELLEQGELQLKTVQYVQLKKCKILTGHVPAPDGTFQSFLATKIRTSTQGKVREDDRGIKAVVGPDGTIYEHLTKLQSKYSLALDCTIGDNTLSFKYTGTRATLTFTQPCDPRIVTQSIDSRQAWLDQLANSNYWPFMTPPPVQREQSQDLQSSVGSSRSESSKYEFEQSDGFLYVLTKKDKMQVANFYIEQILAIYTSTVSPPIYKVLCHCNGEEIVAMLEPSRYRYSTDVFAAFQSIDCSMFTIDVGPAMLAAYLLSIPHKPPKSKLVTYWGLQTDNMVVLGNGAFDATTGDTMRVNETEWAVWDKIFTDDKVHAYKLEDFPRIVRMPLHCKYTVGYKLINEICPQMFLNNYWPAMTVLAWQIVAMYYPYMQKGEFGGGAGNPVLYITGNHGTGKSSASRMAAAMTGHFGPLASGQTTMAAMLRSATQSTLPIHYEDPKFSDDVNSWTSRFGGIVRTFFDGSERMVCGKTDTPRGTFAVSTNEPMPCADDTALWSRVIYVQFHSLVGDPPAASLYSDFTQACMLHSTLMPEYFTLARPTDGFDTCAINDFTAFLDEVTCTSRERNNSGWARVGYTMVLLTKLYQGSYEKMHELLEYVARSCHYQATRMLSSPGLFDRFLTIVLETIARGQSVLYDSDQCVYFHCYRTTILVDEQPTLCLRLDWWAKYLKSKKLLDATAVQLRDARPKEHTQMRSDVPFYDVQLSPWPPTFDGKPYTEAQMMQASLATPKHCIVISEAFINAFERNKCSSLKNINVVLINSHRADIGMYPFVQAICSGDWFGFDMLETHKLAPFFQTNVANMDELNNDIVLEHAEQQLPRVEYCTSIGYIAKVFKISGYNEDELFPCFKTAHFTYKYSETDDTPESPTKRQCTAVRVRGGARPRAPRRAPGDDTLPTRPPPTPVTVRAPMTPVTHRAPQAEKENRSPNLSESALDHVAELLTNDELPELQISMDDLEAAMEFENYAGWS